MKALFSFFAIVIVMILGANEVHAQMEKVTRFVEAWVICPSKQYAACKVNIQRALDRENDPIRWFDIEKKLRIVDAELLKQARQANETALYCHLDPAASLPGETISVSIKDGLAQIQIGSVAGIVEDSGEVRVTKTAPRLPDNPQMSFSKDPYLTLSVHGFENSNGEIESAVITADFRDIKGVSHSFARSFLCH